MTKRKDRRVQRTEELLRKALFSLIREHGFEALTVQDIIDRANIGRATFYAHFDNKEDLLLSGFDQLRASLKQRQREAITRGTNIDERVFGFSHEIIAHVHQHRDLFQAMVGKRSGAVVQNVMHKLLVDLVREDLKAMIVRAEGHPTRTAALAEFLAGGLFGMLLWWLSSRTGVSVEDLNDLFRRFAIPAVKAQAWLARLQD